MLNWPPNFPDLNPVEHPWDVLDKKVRSMEAELFWTSGPREAISPVSIRSVSSHRPEQAQPTMFLCCDGGDAEGGDGIAVTSLP